VCAQFRGAFHLDDPAPGNYTIHYSDWNPEPRPYTVGTGPYLLTAERLAPWDVVLRVWDNTGMMFHGEMVDYSPREEQVLADHVAAGGGNLLVRQPLCEIAVKPVIDLISASGVACDLSVAMAGQLSYSLPPAQTRAVPGGQVATWHDVVVPAGEVTQLLYEVALSPPHPLLEVGGDLGLRSHAPGPLHEVHLARHLDDDRWLLTEAVALEPGEARPAGAVREASRGEVMDVLVAAMHRGGLQAGLSADQLDRFQARYHWARRIVDAASGRAGWTALYRIDAPMCDALLPLQTTPPASQRTRVLWFWVTDIPDQGGGPEPWPVAPDPPALGSLEPVPGDLAVMEYGLIKQRYPRTDRQQERDQDWLGWTFHDDFPLLDPSDNVGGCEDLPLLHLTGSHPAATALMEGLGAIGGVAIGGVVAPWSQRVVTGDDDTWSMDGFFIPGSFPPAVVAQDLGQGRAAAIASRELLTGGVPANLVFVRRLVDWLAGPLTGAADLPAANARIARLQATPNPFNARTAITVELTVDGPLEVTVHDLAGRLVASPWRGELPAGAHALTWDGRGQDGRPVAAGVYMLRARAGSEVRTAKLALVE